MARFLFVALGLAWATALWGQSTIFVTRHAQRGGFEPDPPLTAEGEAQAEALGRLLADADIKHIYSTDTLRTRQTASPTSRRTGVLPVILPQPDFDGMVARVKETLRPGESTLVVVHRETLPRMVKALSGVEIPPLASSEYSRLIAITIFPDGKCRVITLRQGLGNDEPAPKKS